MSFEKMFKRKRSKDKVKTKRVKHLKDTEIVLKEDNNNTKTRIEDIFDKLSDIVKTSIDETVTETSKELIPESMPEIVIEPVTETTKEPISESMPVYDKLFTDKEKPKIISESNTSYIGEYTGDINTLPIGTMYKNKGSIYLKSGTNINEKLSNKSHYPQVSGGGLGINDTISTIKEYTTNGTIEADFDTVTANTFYGDGSNLTGISVSENYDTVGTSGATETNLTAASTRLFVEHSVPFTVIGPVTPIENRTYEIIDVNGIAGTTPITFDCNGKTIRGLSTWDLDADWYVLKIVYNGTDYNII